MAPSFNSPKQELEQGICGQHGWSSSYFQAPSSRWCVEVRWGVGPRNGRVFVSDDVSDGASKAGVKKGHAAAAAVAIEGLRDIVYAANSKPTLTIEEAFGAQFDHTCFVMSGPLGWAKLWEINPTEVFGTSRETRSRPRCSSKCASPSTSRLLVNDTIDHCASSRSRTSTGSATT